MNSLTNLNKVFIPNTLDGINIISDEVQTNALLVDGTNKMLADLNMNTHSIKHLGNATLTNEAVNLGQLSGVSSASYIYSNSVSSASFIYSASVSSSSKLYADSVGDNVSSSSYIYSNSVSSSSKLYADSLAYNVSGSSYIYANTVSSSSKLYADSVGNNVSSSSYIYANTVSSSSKLYADSVGDNVSSSSYLFATTQSGLKVNKTGDTMTGILNLNEATISRNIVIKPKQESYSTGGGGSGTRYNYIRFNFNNADGGGANGRQWCISAQNDDLTTNANDLILRCGAGGGDATLITLGYNRNYFAKNVGIGTQTPSQLLDVNGASIFRGALDMNTTNKIVNLANGTNANDVVNKSQLDLKVDKAGDTMTGVLTINKNAINFQSQSSVVSSYSLTSGNTIFEYLIFTGTSGLTVYVPSLGSSDNSMVNKVVYISFLNASSFTINTADTNNITITRPDVGGSVTTSLNLTLNDVPTKIIRLIGNTTVGNYTLYKVAEVPQSLDQLTLRSNLGNTQEKEFTGIRFLNTTTDAGFIRTETNGAHTNATMSFQVLQSGSIITPLDINSNINAYQPIIRNAWSSGELIQTKIYNQSNFGIGTAIRLKNTAGYLNWKMINFTMLNSPTSSYIVVEVCAPYVLDGYQADEILSRVRDGGDTIFESGSSFVNFSGGGGRGGTFLPMMASYTPSTYVNNTKTRVISIEFDNGADDDLYICYSRDRTGVITAKDYYTIKISEYKI